MAIFDEIHVKVNESKFVLFANKIGNDVHRTLVLVSNIGINTMTKFLPSGKPIQHSIPVSLVKSINTLHRWDV